MDLNKRKAVMRIRISKAKAAITSISDLIRMAEVVVDEAEKPSDFDDLTEIYSGIERYIPTVSLRHFGGDDE